MDIKLPGASAAQWANGCLNCQFGIVRQGPLTGALPLFEERMVQAMRGEVEFCTCRAGHMARQYARRVYSSKSDDARDYCCQVVDKAVTEILQRDRVDTPTVHMEVAA